LARAKIHLAKREAQEAYDHFVTDSGPRQSEYHSKIYAHSRPIPVAAILDDPEFTNFRKTMNPDHLTELQESIQLEGLKIPIVVVDAPYEGYYHVRAGFRRVTAVRNLGWETIAAVVLPADTPEAEEYWVNIIENTAREKLSSHELAEAAKLMRDRFKVPPSAFARKSGHSVEYINELLGCIDRLPYLVIDCWRQGDIPLKILVKLSTLTTTEAIRNCRLWLGQHRIDPVESLKQLQRRPERSTDKLWTVRGLERTQRLHMAVKTSRLPEATKTLCLEIIEYLQGARKRVTNIVVDRVPSSPDNLNETTFLPNLNSRPNGNVNQTNQIEMNGNSLIPNANIPNNQYAQLGQTTQSGMPIRLTTTTKSIGNHEGR
jgi:ParB/RepB/Spo0J family partition protein